MNENLVTIYIANYNYGKFLKKSIDSCLNQSYKNIELIIIDDNSTDNSEAILSNYRNKKGIRILKNSQNLGLTKVNNIAIKLSTGKYIMRLDADDYLEHNAIDLLIKPFLIDNTIGATYGNWYNVDTYGNLYQEEKRISYNTEEALLDSPAHGACTLFSKEILKKIGGYDESLSRQDGYDIWFKLIYNCKIKHIDEPVFYYRKHGNSLSTDNLKLLKVRAKIFEKHANEIEKDKEGTIVIIPIRNEVLDPRETPFLKIGNTILIDVLLETLSGISQISKIVVTSSSKKLKEHVDSLNDRKIKFHYRDHKMEGLNKPLYPTIEKILQSEDRYKSLIITGLKRAFLNKIYIESAINYYKIFDVDSVICVTEEECSLFRKTTNGMRKIDATSKEIKLEKDQIFKKIQDFVLTDINQLKKSQSLYGTKIGHIMVDYKSSLNSMETIMFSKSLKEIIK